MLRLVHHSNETSTEIVPLRYVDWGPGGSLVVCHYYLYFFETEVSIPVVCTFGSALLQNQEVKAGPRDNWGNVKIPRIERLVDERLLILLPTMKVGFKYQTMTELPRAIQLLWESQ